MTQRIKDRLLNAGISFVTATLAVVLGFTLSSSEAKTLRINDKLDDKPNYEYVDTHDAAVQKNLEAYKDEHQVQHTVEMQAVQRQLDIIVKWVENEGRRD